MDNMIIQFRFLLQIVVDNLASRRLPSYTDRNANKINQCCYMYNARQIVNQFLGHISVPMTA